MRWKVQNSPFSQIGWKLKHWKDKSNNNVVWYGLCLRSSALNFPPTQTHNIQSIHSFILWYYFTFRGLFLTFLYAMCDMLVICTPVPQSKTVTFFIFCHFTINNNKHIIVLIFCESLLVSFFWVSLKIKSMKRIFCTASSLRRIVSVQVHYLLTVHR